MQRKSPIIRIRTLLAFLMILSIITGFTGHAIAANPSANLDQWANLNDSWVNGNLGSSKALYHEGDSIPYRLTFNKLSTSSSHSVTIEWDTAKNSKHALDYLTTFNQSVPNADPCLGVNGCGLSTTTTFPIPLVTGDDAPPITGNFTLFGGTITGVSDYLYANGEEFMGDNSAQVTVTFDADVPNPVLAWGGHISTRLDWGETSSAVSISGSPYHTRLIGVDGSGGNQDRSVSSETVVFPGSITIIKDATPEGSEVFDFTASPEPLENFSLVDDGTSANNTKVFSGIENFTTYVITETVPQDWELKDIVCTVSSPNGGLYTTDVTTVNIDMKEGENWTCTYSNSKRTGTLTVIKHVINDNGGTATASQWTMDVTAGNPSSNQFAGAEPPGTTITVDVGAYSVDESGGPEGYSKNLGTDCSGTIAPGESVTCTITNNDIAPTLTLVKTVVNDDGGNLSVGDSPLFIDGTPATSGVAYPQMANVLLTASETPQTGYAPSVWGGDCAADGTITLLPGDAKTCTITNDDIAPTLTLVKTVVNDDGGNAAPDDFSLTVGGNGVLSGVKNTYMANTPYAINETQLTGYTFVSISGDPRCPAVLGGTVTLDEGDDITCTITNDDQTADLRVAKSGKITYTIVVTNDGPSTAYNVIVNDDLPGDLTWTIKEPVPEGFSIDGNKLQGTIASLGSKVSVEVTVEATIPQGNYDNALLENHVTASSDTPDPNKNNNSADADIGPTPTSP